MSNSYLSLLQGLRRSFDLSGLIPLYLEVSTNLATIERNKNLELNVGRATIIYSVDDNDTIHLISGWSGNRKKIAL